MRLGRMVRNIPTRLVSFVSGSAGGGAQETDADSLPIDEFVYGTIDTPLDDAVVTSSQLAVSGWAVSRLGNIERVVAYLDEYLLGPLDCGLPRADVSTALHLPDSDYGFAGRVDVPRSAKSGSHVLRIAVTDDTSHTCTLFRSIQLTENAVAEPTLVLHLDTPAHNMLAVDLLPVRGWAFSAISPVVAIDAELDSEPTGTLYYGAQRDDVFNAYRIPISRMSGLEGTIDVRKLRPGVHKLTVRARAYNGATASITQRFRVRPRTAEHLDVDRCEWRGDTLTVEGWAILPGEHRPWRVTVFADDKPVATGRVGLSRPDIQACFPELASAVRSGFNVSGPVLAPPPAPTRGDAQVRVRVEDAHGHRVEHTFSVHHTTDEFAQVVTACRADLEDLIWQARLRTQREPSILNLTRDYPIAEAFPNCNVFGLPDGIGDERAAAFAQGAADIVITDERPVPSVPPVPSEATSDALPAPDAEDGAIAVTLNNTDPGADLDEPAVARVARDAIAHVLTAELRQSVPTSLRGTLDGSSGRRSPRVVAHWNPEAALSPIPSVSVVIPVHDKVAFTRACVERVLSTVQSAIPLQVIVVDDCSTDETPAVLASLAEADDRVQVVRNEENLGFLRSSNRGAEVATGEILVFLNNDTLPEPHWLEPLLFTLLTHPEAGAVGGKLVYPDGLLQEAGGVIFSDASGANYGRGDVTPDHPLYHSLREVDYCSGALLATPRELFVALGAFDERYSPAYYEDTDYCFRVREHGRRVYYQPESVIIHFEGVSNGRDLAQGIKRYQVVNRAKFMERWADALQRQGPPAQQYDRAAHHTWAVRHERERSEQTGARAPRRALLVFATVPEFNHEGGSRQHAALIEFLRSAGWQVTVVANATGKENWYVRALRQQGVQVYFGPSCALVGDGYLETIDELLQDARFQLAILAPWHIAEDWTPILRTHAPETRIIVDSMDAHFLRAIRQALVQSDPFSGAAARWSHAASAAANHTAAPASQRAGGQASSADAPGGRLLIDRRIGDEMIRELSAYANADMVLTVSAKEAAFLSNFLGSSTVVEVLPLVEGIPHSTVPAHERHGIVFIGNFRHKPNVEAVEYLCEKIVPLLSPKTLRAHPIIIIGTDMPTSLWELTRRTPGVLTLGWVPSVVPYLNQARISLAPLLHGAGTKVKLIQALMAGVPSVSTSIGVEGLLLEDEQHILVADDPQRFADAITRLVEDDHLWAHLSVSGYEHIHARHNPEIIRDRFTTLLQRVLRPTDQAASPAEQTGLPHESHEPSAFSHATLPSDAHADSALRDDSSDEPKEPSEPSELGEVNVLNQSNGTTNRSPGFHALLVPSHQRVDEP